MGYIGQFFLSSVWLNDYAKQMANPLQSLTSYPPQNSALLSLLIIAQVEKLAVPNIIINNENPSFATSDITMAAERKPQLCMYH